MTRLLDDLSWSKTNLLKGTSDQWKKLTVSDWMNVTTSSDRYFKFEGTSVGTLFTYSVTVNNTVNQPVELQAWLCNEQKERLADIRGDTFGFTMSEYLEVGQTKDISTSFPQLDGAVYVDLSVCSHDGTVPQGSIIQLKDERLYTGTEPGIWTPNHADRLNTDLPNLLPNTQTKYLPNAETNGNFDCYNVYKDTSINMKQGEKYILIAETNGTFSSQHEPTVESDKCVLWLADNNAYTQLISDEHTSQGTVFTWNGLTGNYYLRVNAYHKGADNTIYASNIRIYEI